MFDCTEVIIIFVSIIEQCSLRVSGRNNEESEFIKMGQHHTLELELNQPFRLEKPCWDSVYVDRLKEAADACSKVCSYKLFDDMLLLYIIHMTNSINSLSVCLSRRTSLPSVSILSYDCFSHYISNNSAHIIVSFGFSVTALLLIVMQEVGMMHPKHKPS